MIKLNKNTRGSSVVELLILLVIVGAIVASGWLVYRLNSINKWKLYTNQTGYFDARFPSSPSHTMQTSPFDGTTVTNYYTYTGSLTPSFKGAAYSVRYVPLPRKAALSSASKPYQILDSYFQTGLNDQKNSHIVSTKNGTLDGYPALYYENTVTVNSQNDYFDGVMVLANYNFYIVESQNVNTVAPNSQYFLDSFKITGGLPAALKDDIAAIDNDITPVENDLALTQQTSSISSNLSKDCAQLTSDVNVLYNNLQDSASYRANQYNAKSGWSNFSDNTQEVYSDAYKCTQDIQKKDMNDLLKDVKVDLPNAEANLARSESVLH